MKKVVDCNSSENQRIKGDFVSREVYYCVSSLIYDLSQDEKYQDDLMDLQVKYRTDTDQLKSDIVQDYKEELDDWFKEHEECEEKNIEELDEDTLKELAGDLGLNVDDYEETVEVYEHWLVSEWLAKKLEEKGEITGEFKGLTIWGRTCTGQAILLDWVISSICEDLDLLK